MCFHIGIDIKRSEHIKLKGIKKKVTDFEVALNQPYASGFDYPRWPVFKPISEENEVMPVMMHWEFIPSYINSLE